MKSVLIIGLGRFGRHISKRLSQMDHEVLAVDKIESRVDAALPYVTNAQIGDSTNLEFLESLGVRNFDVCIVTIAEDFQSSLITTAYLKELGAKKVVSRANRDVHEKFLLRNGADDVIYPEKQLAAWTAIKYTADNISDYIDLGEGCAMIEVVVPEHWAGKSLADLNIRKKYNLNIVATKENGKMNLSVDPYSELSQNEIIVVMGTIKDLKKCFKL